VKAPFLFRARPQDIGQVSARLCLEQRHGFARLVTSSLDQRPIANDIAQHCGLLARQDFGAKLIR